MSSVVGSSAKSETEQAAGQGVEVGRSGESKAEPYVGAKRSVVEHAKHGSELDEIHAHVFLHHTFGGFGLDVFEVVVGGDVGTHLTEE